MAYTRIDIISLAIQLLGQSPISDISSGGPLAASANRFYDLILEKEISKREWRFATTIQQLTKLSEEPIVDNWSYIYSVPSNYLAFVRFYPHTSKFLFYGNNRVYSNVDELKMEYRYKPEPYEMPSYFVDFFQYAIAARLAMAHSISRETSSTINKELIVSESEAINIDFRNNPNPDFVRNPYREAR